MMSETALVEIVLAALAFLGTALGAGPAGVGALLAVLLGWLVMG